MLPAMDSTEVSLQSCPECAAQMPQDAGFCPGCGRSMPVVPSRAQGKVGILPERVAGVLAYIPIVLPAVFLFVKPYKKNRFVRFHSFQSLGLCGSVMVTAAVLRLASLILLLIPILGPLLVVITAVVAGLASLFLWFVLIVKAMQGEMFELPLLGQLARRYAVTS